ncbi:hypothetical protein DL765_010865 [Monosporascus sp. GIB2]|nr:hypothetical protein DL765_010865 [Monosporascus sp. GIB2]
MPVLVTPPAPDPLHVYLIKLPPLPPGRYDTFRPTILQLRRNAAAALKDDEHDDTVKGDLDRPVSLPSGPPLPPILDTGRIGLHTYPVGRVRDAAAAAAAAREVPPAGYREKQEMENLAAVEDAGPPGTATDEEDNAYADRPRTRPDRSSKRGTETFLSSDQITLWTDVMLLPVIYEAVTVAEDGDTTIHDENRSAVPDFNVFQYLPSLYAAAVHLTNALREAAATGR